MTKYIDGLNRIVWGAPALVLIVGVGLYLSLRLRFAQLTLFPGAWRRFVAMLRLGRKSEDGVTPFQACLLYTSLRPSYHPSPQCRASGSVSSRPARRRRSSGRP